jgi:transcriptional regulator with XRE-family HTH domain
MHAHPDREPTDETGDAVTFGRWLRATREEREITQQALADRAGISRSYLSDLERGRGVRPTLLTLDRLATALGSSRVEALSAAGVLHAPTRDAMRRAEDRLLARYRGLSEQGRAAVERFIRFTYEEEQRWVQPSFGAELLEPDHPEHSPRHHRTRPVSLFDLTPSTPEGTDDC